MFLLDPFQVTTTYYSYLSIYIASNDRAIYGKAGAVPVLFECTVYIYFFSLSSIGEVT